MFERDGKTLREWILQLASDDAAARGAAAEAITLMMLGAPSKDTSFWDCDDAEVAGLGEAVYGVFTTPDFPADEVLHKLIDLYRRNPKRDAQPKLSAVLRAARGRPDADRSFVRTVACLLQHVGEPAKVILPELIALIEARPGGSSARQAAEAIAAIGPSALPAVDALFTGLCKVGDEEDVAFEDRVIWNAFVRALAGLACHEPSIVERLTDLARNGEETARHGALVTLGEIGPAASVSLPVLRELAERDADTSHVIDAIRAIAPANDVASAELLRRRLVTCRVGDRPVVVEALRAAGIADAEIADLLDRAARPEDCTMDEYEDEDEADDDALEDDMDDDDLCMIDLSEVDTTTDMGKRLGDLLRDLASNDAQAANVAGNTLVEYAFGKDSRVFGGEVAAVFADPDYPTGEVLGGISARLAAMYRDRDLDRETRDFSAGRLPDAMSPVGLAMPAVLENCGPGGAIVLPALADLLTNDSIDHQLSAFAAKAMLSIGEPARPILDALLDSILTHDVCEWPNPRLEYIARHGLSDAQLARIVAAVEGGAAPAQIGALGVLKSLGPRASSATKVVRRAASSRVEEVRAVATETLAAIAGDDPDLVATLLQQTHDADGHTRMRAARALGELRGPTDEVIDRLFAMTRDEEWYVCGDAIHALGRLGRRVPEVLQHATIMLEDERGADWTVSECAVLALGELGDAAAPAVPLLLPMIEDYGHVDYAVVEALGKIGPPAAAALDQLRTLRAYEFTRHDELDDAIAAIRGR